VDQGVWQTRDEELFTDESKVADSCCFGNSPAGRSVRLGGDVGHLHACATHDRSLTEYTSPALPAQGGQGPLTIGGRILNQC